MRPERLVFVFAALSLSLGCSLGQGEGRVSSDHLLARDCWDRTFDLQPDFFAALPYRDSLLIRVQRGTDLQEVSDGLSVLIDDVNAVRAGRLGQPLEVALPPGVAPPGSPVGVGLTPGEPAPAEPAEPEPAGSEAPLAHVALYLQASCHNQNTVLYAVRGTITFQALFSGDPNEKDAAEKLIDSSGMGSGGEEGGEDLGFDVWVGDPRDAPLGEPGSAIPDDKLSRVTGFFRFYFERGQPGQPFP